MTPILGFKDHRIRLAAYFLSQTENKWFHEKATNVDEKYTASLMCK